MTEEKKELKDEELEKAQGGLSLDRSPGRLRKPPHVGDDDDKPGEIDPSPKEL